MAATDYLAGGRRGGFERRSANSRMAFSTMYEMVRSSSRASSTNTLNTAGSTRAATGTFFSDSGSGFRGMSGSVIAVASIAFSYISTTALTAYTFSRYGVNIRTRPPVRSWRRG